MTAVLTMERLEPASDDVALDLEHLTRMTLGDRSLEREVLALFSRQADMLLQRMDVRNPAVAVACAHTLKGSALGIGAHRVARSAAAIERADLAGLAAAIAALSMAVAEAKAAVADIQAARHHPVAA